MGMAMVECILMAGIKPPIIKSGQGRETPAKDTAMHEFQQEHKWSTQAEAILSWFERLPLSLDIDPDFFVDPFGNLVVRARAGTGKTTVIIAGVKRAPEKKVLVCAFSKIIQVELEKRLGKNPDKVAKTFHSIGLACVLKFRPGIKWEFSSTRADKLTESVCGRGVPDTIKKLVTILHTKGREITPYAKHPGDLIELAIKFDCEPDEQWENSGFPLERIEEYALAAMELAADVKSGDTIDGSDMIFLPVRNGWLYPMYDLVVVDETQDMNTAQLEIAKGVLRVGGRMCIVGDDRQSIFGFRGADSDTIDRMKAELNAAELGLTVTYRCGKRIVRLAQEYVPDISAALQNPEGKIDYCTSVDLLAQAGPSDYILSRVNAPLVSTAMKLLRAGKRTKINGMEIGKGLVNLVRKLKARSVPEFLGKVVSWETKQIVRLKGMLDQAEENRKKFIESKMADVNDRAAMLLELADGAKNVDEIQNRIENLFKDDGLGDAGMIVCSSIHRAKGLEADRVFILEDTLRQWNTEEQNLCYVAITRAKKTLVWVSDKRANA